MFRYILAILLFTSNAFAVDRYVNGASSCSGCDGTTNGLSGSTAAYDSIAAALTAETATSGTLTLLLEGATTDSTDVNITGHSFTTLIIKSNTGTRYKHENSSYADNFKVAMTGVTLQDFDIGKSGSGAKDINILHTTTACNDLTIDGMRVYYTGTWTSDGGSGAIYINEGTGTTIVRNTYVHDNLGVGIYANMNGGTLFQIDNNTVVNSTGVGIETVNNGGAPTTSTLRNNISDGSGGNDYTLGVTPTTSLTNISSDATSPQTGLRSITITYDTAPMLDATESDAIDQGTDLTGVFTRSYSGQVRDATPTIGADEITTGNATSYVTCGCTYDGLGDSATCAAGAGLTGAYNSIANWNTGEEAKHKYDAADVHTVNLNDDSGTNCALETTTFTTWDADDLDFVFQPLSGSEHSGSWDEALPVIELTTINSHGFKITKNGNFTFTGLQMHVNATSGTAYLWYSQSGYGTGDTILIEDGIYRYTSGGGNLLRWVSQAVLTFRNNVVYDHVGIPLRIASRTAYIHHNTFVDNGSAIQGSSSTNHVSNNLFQGNTCAYANNGTPAWGTQEYNVIESDCSGNQAEGVNDVVGTTITFTNEGSDIFTTDDNTNACVDNNLYAHGTLPVVDDFEADARASSGETYAGWDESTTSACGAGGGGVMIFRRRRMEGY